MYEEILVGGCRRGDAMREEDPCSRRRCGFYPNNADIRVMDAYLNRRRSSPRHQSASLGEG